MAPATQRIEIPSLIDFVPTVTPRWDAPHHLKAIADLFERAFNQGNVFACVSVPPQHGKTELTLHAISWWLKQRPHDAIGYITYSSDISRSKSRLARDYAREAHITIRNDSNALHEWRTPENGGVLATGIGGPLTSHGLQLLIVDDPFKNRQDAESKTIRDTTEGWFRSTGLTRLHHKASCIVIHTRWHPDDLIGRLASDKGIEWEIINLPAINENGEALWPEKRPIEFLERQRKLTTAFEFEALYQGRPRPRGGHVFNDVRYGDAPIPPYRAAIGIDLAYSTKTHADYSVSLVMLEREGVFHIANVQRKQVQAPEFGLTLRSHQSQYPGARMRWYAAGTEFGVSDFLKRSGINVEPERCIGDKFARAQPVAAAWNSGRITVPKDAPWLGTFLDEVLSFTGVNDPHDDMVDALAASFDLLATSGRGEVTHSNQRRATSSLKGYY